MPSLSLGIGGAQHGIGILCGAAGGKGERGKDGRAEDPRTVLGNDCLAPEGYGEIIGGSQREDDYDRLLERIKAQGLDPEAYRWYLDLRRYGTFVHSGFGLGLERTVAWICGLAHIREAIAFPRQIHRLFP